MKNRNAFRLPNISRKWLILSLALCVCLVSALLSLLETNHGFTLFAKRSNDSNAEFMRVIDIGEGDAILFCSGGQTALVDAGDNLDGGMRIVEKLQTYGIQKIDLMIATHLHADHIGGMDDVLKYFEVDQLILPGFLDSDAADGYAVRDILKVTEQADIELRSPEVGMEFEIGRFHLRILAYDALADSINNRSLILKVTYDQVQILLTGDAERQLEQQLIDEGIDLTCDILKVAHHGSATSSSEAFLRAARPKCAIISCGIDNSYSHPDTEVVSRLEKRHATVYRTDLQGDITVYPKDHGAHILPEKKTQ